MDKKILLNIIAIILGITMILVVIHLISWKNYSAFLWICYTAIPLTIIGIVTRKSWLILSQVSILLIPDLLWTIELIYVIITGNPMFGVSTYFLERTFFEKIVSLQHIYTVPLSILALSFIKIKKDYRILLLSLAEILFFFVLTINIASIEYPVNCLPTNCTTFSLDFLPYNLIWIISTFSFAIIGYFIITSLPFVKEKS